jgi:preprotein translocase subunit SecY
MGHGVVTAASVVARGLSLRTPAVSLPLSTKRRVAVWNSTSNDQITVNTRSPISTRVGAGRNNDILYAPGLLESTNTKTSQWAVRVSSVLRYIPPELCRRIGVTFVMMTLARIGHYVPIPGVGMSPETSPTSFTASLTTSTASEVAGNIYLLSITPYMTAGLTLAALQLIPEVRRHIESLREEGRSGREAIQAYTSILFVVAALIQSISYASQLCVNQTSVWFFKLQTTVTLMAGAVLCKYAVQCIDQHGLGDGTGVIIGSGIALSYIEYISRVIEAFHVLPVPPLLNILAAVSVTLGVVILVTWVHGIELRLPLTFFSARKNTTNNNTFSSGEHGSNGTDFSNTRSPSSSSNHHPVIEKLKTSGGNSIDMQALFPLRLSPSGTRQLLFANFWASLLDAPLSAIGLQGALNNPFTFALVVFLFEALNFADATPKQIATFLSQNDAGIIGLSPGEETTAFLSRKKAQLKFANAAFIAMISLLSRAIDILSVWLIGVAPGTLNILLLVSTIMGGSRQVDALCTGHRVEQRLNAEKHNLISIARHGYCSTL